MRMQRCESPHHISSSLEPGQVVNFFRRELGDAGFNPKGGGGTWRFPVGSESPDRVLTVLKVEEEGPHSNCKERIPSGAKSILILSRKRRRRKMRFSRRLHCAICGSRLR